MRNNNGHRDVTGRCKRQHRDSTWTNETGKLQEHKTAGDQRYYTQTMDIRTCCKRVHYTLASVLHFALLPMATSCYALVVMVTISLNCATFACQCRCKSILGLMLFLSELVTSWDITNSNLFKWHFVTHGTVLQLWVMVKFMEFYISWHSLLLLLGSRQSWDELL